MLKQLAKILRLNTSGSVLNDKERQFTLLLIFANVRMLTLF
jgi:hypothetical protein